MKKMLFESMQDVYDELERIYDNAHDKNRTDNIGKSLYISAGYFVDYEKLVCNKIQNTIKKVTYSNKTKTPVYSTVQETPVSFIDDYFIIDEEIDSINKETKANKK
tara:strand:- start:662 stop:979 length:318 start_codon:yes stop_codon:yes gene_type:complete